MVFSRLLPDSKTKCTHSFPTHLKTYGKIHLKKKKDHKLTNMILQFTQKIYLYIDKFLWHFFFSLRIYITVQNTSFVAKLQDKSKNLFNEPQQ